MEFCKCPQFVAQVLFVFLCTLDSLAQATTYTATCSVAVNGASQDSFNDSVTGTVSFTQVDEGNITIGINLSGFDTSDSYTQHGFHVHELNDQSNGCNSMGGHYNPTSVDHAAPTASSRHIGDLGNIEEDGSGNVVATITDPLVKLTGNYSVLDRAIVIHHKADDLGLGGDAGSLASGNAGTRLACCVITSTSKASGATAYSTHVLLAGALLCFLSRKLL